MSRKLFALMAAVMLSASSVSFAQTPIKIGLTGTFTGPNASNGIPYREAAEVFPATMGGHPVEWIILDDGGDATSAMKNARRFVDVDKVDAIVGSTSSPTAMTLFDIANNSKTSQLAMSPVAISDEKKAFVFNVPQPVSLMSAAIVDDMKKNGVKTAAFIGYADGWGDLNWNIFKDMAPKAGIEVVAEERYNRTDPSVIAQALKVIAVDPDAVFIGASTTPAVLPHATLRDQGYEGPIYQTHGTVAQAFLDAGGEAVEGARMPTGPMVAADELPDDNPIKQVSLDFIKNYQAKWGDGPVSPFAGYAWDAMLILDAAAEKALASGAKPGTEAFRVALRDGIQSGEEVVGTNGVYRYTPDDHYGLDERARVMITVEDNQFRLLEE
ncbi:MAG TPA: branched-chain amino acid ABC transporter substrate-binding protein [Pusillimonas sp.]|jgi:branched-chain amino acid transport system substrate-binding protein|nr:branched-chain amino acid ABC transporter substrate-binding protein [Pusillimonas sp.]MBC41996.1 branched-chain amino acid ABC transporter substrate-binding protein [Pusillimonas sp.]HBT31696.1 branched-chain amino acid ABC transporter substrate-binding protein [Pusillimonas sp.]HCN70958.1 branched-chain amino acid ABC transporter substrate-binding protein [Pusillimonas sp.]